MSDSDEDYDSGDEKVNLTGFLFGNIDEKGRLEGGLLDEDSRRHLSSLSRLGLGSFVNDIISNKSQDESQDSGFGSQESQYSSSQESEQWKSSNGSISSSQESDVDYKSPSAVDYSDIAEAADDECKNLVGQPGYDAQTRDLQLMPPPSGPLLPRASAADSVAYLKKLNTPLAAMLPSKYAHMDVTELFPEFRHDKVPRFMRLFGPTKPSSLPQIWRGVKRRRKKKTEAEEEALPLKEIVLNYADTPPAHMLVDDEEERFLMPMEPEKNVSKRENSANVEHQPNVADWRYGPAQFWYDNLEVPDTGDTFTYGFRLKDEPKPVKEEVEEGPFDEPPVVEDPQIPEDCFLMSVQLNWEDDIVWNGEDQKKKLNPKKTRAAGWVPSSESRTAQPGKLTGGVTMGLPGPLLASQQTHTTAQALKGGKHSSGQDGQDETYYSMFPVENEDLVHRTWEDEVIWDAENMDTIPQPKIVTLDPNDDNIILGIPDDIDPATLTEETTTPTKVKIPHPHVKKSRLLLGKAGVITMEVEDNSPPPSPKNIDKDPFNISNDEFYQPKSEPSLKVHGGGNLIQHSTPVVELRAPFIPTHMGPIRLRNFHRPPLKRYSHGPVAHPGPHPVLPLVKEIKRKMKQRELERQAAGGGDIFFMRTPEDLSGTDSELILTEFCEEHPPLVMQVGMCTKIKNYYKRRAGKDSGPPELRYGETAFAHTSPFLGVLHPGQTIQTLENNMYRAPMYEHKIPESDFLVIRTRQNYFIREVDGLFTVGQECPLYEVPGPNSKRANNFVRDFLQVFIYRLFWKSKDSPRRIKMDDIKKAFPSHSESSIRKRLKPCADFKRTGMDSNWWVLKPEFRLPPEEEIRNLVSPEQCCSYFSMIAAEQRLKDAGYGEKFLLVPQDDDDDDLQKMDDEVKVAPWNSTRAYIQACKNKCLLQLTGPADPTGTGEGFSYIRMPNKPQVQNKEELDSQPKRIVTGTDADLRRLSLNNAKALLRKYGVPEEEIKKLSRWEVIDVVRTLSTEKAKSGEEGVYKFSRGNRFSIAEHQERYKEECQRIFDLQNRVLASEEVLSTDEGGSSSEEDAYDIEEMGKNIENMLANRKTSSQLSHEREEQERRQLHKMFMGEGGEEDDKKKQKRKEDEDTASVGSFGANSGKKLKITRTFRNPDGKEYTRIETVRHPTVIDAYVRIRQTKDETFIKQFATLDEHQKEEMKREKRRLQEQLRRIRRNQEKERLGLMKPKVKKPKPKLKPDLKLKCGACGQVGHMRTNRACPLYQPSQPTPPINVAMTEEQEDEMEKQVVDDKGLVNVDGTKIKLSASVVKHAEEIKRKSLLLKFPKAAMALKKRRRTGSDAHCDYLKRNKKVINRRRIDPVIALSTILESILNEMREVPDVQPFCFQVNAKAVPDYYKIVSRPMDLQTIRENLHQKKYQSRAEFLTDVHQIVENSDVYNGSKSALTGHAQNMFDLCVERLREKEEKLMKLEKAINPLLDDDDQVALTYILDNILNNKIKSLQEAWPFLKPVNRKNVKDYYNVIKIPMCLEYIEKKVKDHKYHNRREFLTDIRLIFENSQAYNGPDSDFTKKAEKIYQVAKETIQEYNEHLDNLERKIEITQERALEAAEDSLTIEETEIMPEMKRPRLSGGKSRLKTTIKREDDDGSRSKEQKDLLAEDLQMSPENSDDEYEDMDDDEENASYSEQEEEYAARPGFYQETLNQPEEEEMVDVDANYDPTEFLFRGFQGDQPIENATDVIDKDLQVSESEDEQENDSAIWF